MKTVTITYFTKMNPVNATFVHKVQTTSEDFAVMSARRALLALLDERAGTVGTADFETVSEVVE